MDNFWNYMEEMKLAMDLSEVSQSVLCVICEDLLKDAVFLKCGCRFCAKCISNFLNNESCGGGHFCPGCLKEDTDTDLSENFDVMVDPASNRDVAKLKLKCPHAGCSDSVEMRAMLEHVLTCGNAVVDNAESGTIRRYKSITMSRKKCGETLEEVVERLQVENRTIRMDVDLLKKKFDKFTEQSKLEIRASGCEVVQSWRVSDMHLHLDRGDRYGPVFSVAGRRLGFVVALKMVRRRGHNYYYLHCNLVIHPGRISDSSFKGVRGAVSLKLADKKQDKDPWGHGADLFLQLLDPVTDKVAAHTRFGPSHQTAWATQYVRSTEKIVLSDSSLIVNPYAVFPNWDGKSLVIRCGLQPTPPEAPH